MTVLASIAGRPHTWRTGANGRPIGLAISMADIALANNPDHWQDARAILAREATIITQTDLHWPGREPTQGVFDWDVVDVVDAWARSLGLQQHLHLFSDGTPAAGWPLPPWVGSAVTNAATAESVLRTWLAAQCTRYPAPLHATICGEPLVEGTSGVPGPGGTFLRDGIFGSFLGVNLIDIAFDEVHSHWPTTDLLLNQFHLESHQAVRDDMLTLVDDLLSRGVPVTSVGIESHLSPGTADDPGNGIFFKPADNAVANDAFLTALQSRGIEAHITELDINDHASFPVDIAARDAVIAGYIKDCLDSMLPHSNLHSATIWGIADGTPITNAQTPRGDGLPGRPLPWDAGYQPKTMYSIIRDAITQHWGA